MQGLPLNRLQQGFWVVKGAAARQQRAWSNKNKVQWGDWDWQNVCLSHRLLSLQQAATFNAAYESLSIHIVCSLPATFIIFILIFYFGIGLLIHSSSRFVIWKVAWKSFFPPCIITHHEPSRQETHLEIQIHLYLQIWKYLLLIVTEGSLTVHVLSCCYWCTCHYIQRVELKLLFRFFKLE